MSASEDSLVTGELHRPAGRRRSYLLLVRHCPLCRCAHAHRAYRVMNLYVRAPSCRPGTHYTVHVPAAAPEAQDTP